MDAKEYLFGSLREFYEKTGELSEKKTLYTHRRTGAGIVLTVLPGDADPSAFARLAGVQNTRAARVLDLIEGDGESYVLTEYVPGRTLAEVMRTDPPKEKEIRGFALDLCDALIELHEMGVAHKDVKPENVIVGEDGHAHLVDFGIATVFDEGRRAKTSVMGTVGFAAPEQFGFNRTDARTDLYAFGVLLNLLLTRAHPTVELYRRGRYGKILKKLLSVNPADRFPDARALKRALLSC